MIEKPKAIHGNWSDWKKWETCSQECGFGIRTRERTCDSPRWVAFIMANIKYRSPHKRTDAVFREAWFLYMVITVPNVSWMIFMLVSIWLKLSWHCRKLISYPGIAQAAGGSFKKTNCCHAVIFVFPLKNNRHDTFLTCRNCRWDRTWVYLDDTVVNCCELLPACRDKTFLHVSIWSQTLLWWQLQHVREWKFPCENWIHPFQTFSLLRYFRVKWSRKEHIGKYKMETVKNLLCLSRPRYGGKYCVGNSTEQEICKIKVRSH
jgi:hypothetical protein